MTTSQRAVVAVRALPLYEAEAKTRLREAGRLKGKANLPGAEKGQARVALCETPRARAAPAVEAAELSVQRVLKALATNSFDACEEAGVAPEITIRVDDEGITIIDNGPGIPAETVIEPANLGPRSIAVRPLCASRTGAAGPRSAARRSLSGAWSRWPGGRPRSRWRS